MPRAVEGAAQVTPAVHCVPLALTLPNWAWCCEPRGMDVADWPGAV